VPILPLLVMFAIVGPIGAVAHGALPVPAAVARGRAVVVPALDRPAPRSVRASLRQADPGLSDLIVHSSPGTPVDPTAIVTARRP